MTQFLLALIRLYQRTLSPLLGDCCRFEPSCSRYAVACLEAHGSWRGSLMAVKRILRCNPLFPGGIDMPQLPTASSLALEPDWSRVVRLCSCGVDAPHALSAQRLSAQRAAVQHGDGSIKGRF